MPSTQFIINAVVAVLVVLGFLWLKSIMARKEKELDRRAIEHVKGMKDGEIIAAIKAIDEGHIVGILMDEARRRGLTV